MTTIQWTAFLSVLGLNLIALISPGPDFAMTVRNSITSGRRAGLATALGIASGEVVHLLYTICGFGLILSKMLWLLFCIKIAGAIYLTYIGYKALKTRKSTDEKIVAGSTSISVSTAWRMGFLTNLLNPKAILFFLSIFTVVVDPTTPMPILALIAVAMTLETFFWFAVVALCFSGVKIQSFFHNIRHWVDRVTGGILIALGVKLAFTIIR